jgi:excisionase family DNA binding protein
MKESEPIQKRLFTIREVAKYTGLSIHTLYAMVSQRRIPYVKVGRLTKYDLTAHSSDSSQPLLLGRNETALYILDGVHMPL